MDDALALCAAAAADGTTVVVATPHINFEYARVGADTVHAEVPKLRDALARAGIAIDVRTGGEVALVRTGELSDEDLRRLTLNGGPTLLLELPWRASGTGMTAAVARVAARGFQVLLAHPERTPLLRDDLGLVRALVGAGACCCLNAGSLSTAADRQTRGAGQRLLAAGLVHAVASDAHDTVRRIPARVPALEEAGLSPAEIKWFCETAPAALLEGHRPGDPPDLSDRFGRRLFRRLRGPAGR